MQEILKSSGGCNWSQWQFLWINVINSISRYFQRILIIYLTCWCYLHFCVIQTITDQTHTFLHTHTHTHTHCNGYCHRKRTQRLKYKFWARMVAFHIVLIHLEKVWIQLYSLLLWVNNWANQALNFGKAVTERKSLNSTLLNSLKLRLYHILFRQRNCMHVTFLSYISRKVDKPNTYNNRFNSDISFFIQRRTSSDSSSLNKEWNITTKPILSVWFIHFFIMSDLTKSTIIHIYIYIKCSILF